MVQKSKNTTDWNNWVKAIGWVWNWKYLEYSIPNQVPKHLNLAVGFVSDPIARQFFQPKQKASVSLKMERQELTTSWVPWYQEKFLLTENVVFFFLGTRIVISSASWFILEDRGNYIPMLLAGIDIQKCAQELQFQLNMSISVMWSCWLPCVGVCTCLGMG